MATEGIAKSHRQAVLEGSNAELATAEARPVFYAYIQPDGIPFRERNITLVKFNVKNHRREINASAYSQWTERTTGVDAQSLLKFRSEQIKPGIV